MARRVLRTYARAVQSAEDDPARRLEGFRLALQVRERACRRLCRHPPHSCTRNARVCVAVPVGSSLSS